MSKPTTYEEALADYEASLPPGTRANINAITARVEGRETAEAARLADVASRNAQAAEQRKQARAEAYRTESDPLFFQEQRGEVPAGTWLAKVEEIKAQYPA